MFSRPIGDTPYLNPLYIPLSTLAAFMVHKVESQTVTKTNDIIEYQLLRNFSNTTKCFLTFLHLYATQILTLFLTHL